MQGLVYYVLEKALSPPTLLVLGSGSSSIEAQGYCSEGHKFKPQHFLAAPEQDP